MRIDELDHLAPLRNLLFARRDHGLLRFREPAPRRLGRDAGFRVLALLLGDRNQPLPLLDLENALALNLQALGLLSALDLFSLDREIRP